MMPQSRFLPNLKSDKMLSSFINFSLFFDVIDLSLKCCQIDLFISIAAIFIMNSGKYSNSFNNLSQQSFLIHMFVTSCSTRLS